MTNKRKHPRGTLWYTYLTLLVFGASLIAAEPEVAGKAQNPLVKDFTITATEIKFPGLTINRETHEVHMDATVCLDRGILEYMVCVTGTFEHESIFVTKVKPEILHTALLLTGFEPNPMSPGLEFMWWSKALEAEKSRVRIDVEWETDGIVQRANITSMIRKNTGNDIGMDDYETSYPPGDEAEEVSDAWVFSGSFIRAQENGKRIYASNRSGIVIGIWRNPSAVIQYGKPTGNPYRRANQGMAVNEFSAPKEGTRVKLIFYKYDPLDSDFLDD